MSNNLTPPEPPADPSVAPQPAFIRGRKYTMEDLKPILDGKVMLPNFEAITPERAVYSASQWYGSAHNGRAKRDEKYPSQALFFLRTDQRSGLTGEGMVMTTAWAGGVLVAIAGTFALCQHESVEDPGANHSRGWHPAHCKHCGLDLSVDSGD